MARLSASAKARSGPLRVSGDAAGSNTRRKKGKDDGVPDVYKEMLSEASKEGVDNGESRPLKRRRKGDRPAAIADASTVQPNAKGKAPVEEPSSPILTSEAESTRPEQTITADTEDSEESDFEWEDVGLQQQNNIGLDFGDHVDTEPEEDRGGISIDLSAPAPQPKASKASLRKVVTADDRRQRLLVHKLHILCLIAHVHLRNSWCNDLETKKVLRKLLPSKITSYLILNPDHSQFQAAEALTEGLKLVSAFWRQHYKITAYGQRRPRWASSTAELRTYTPPKDADSPMDRIDFRKAAVLREGSLDLGAQLFCALLRSLGLETRLVCSLQVLPFTAAAEAPSTPNKSPGKKTVYADHTASEGESTSEVEKSATKPKDTMATSWTKTDIAMRKLTKMTSSSLTRAGPSNALPAPRKKPKIAPRFPVYWVEVFNEPHQKWVSVDPLATNTVGKPSRIEPPLNDPENCLAYAIAFEDDAVAKDVTRRYARAYNAKTRKYRVECSGDGGRWMKRTLRIFKRPAPLDRDQVEDGALAQREAAEGMPKNVQDFKNHPYYVLERHLRRNEVLEPRREVGKVNVGSPASSKLEPVYRRQDVHIVRSADKWYRMGRDVLPSEQPLKHAAPRKGRASSEDAELDPATEEPFGEGLYAEFQTELYIPPPVIRGKVPRNAYGNLDVYVPSMVPPGGVHIPSPDAARAAKLLGIDSAAAVTGFQFKGRQGTAVVQGVVVATEYREAVIAIINGFAHEKEEAEENRRTIAALRMWKRFLTGLRIVERVKGYAEEGEEGEEDVRDRLDREVEEEHEMEDAGGFFPDEAQMTAPTASRAHDDRRSEAHGGGFSLSREASFQLESYASTLKIRPSADDARSAPQLPYSDGYGESGGFLPDADDAGGGDGGAGGGFILGDDNEGAGFLPNDNSEGRGFMPEASNDKAGGFIPAHDLATPDTAPPTTSATKKPQDHNTDLSAANDPKDKRARDDTTATDAESAEDKGLLSAKADTSSALDDALDDEQLHPSAQSADEEHQPIDAAEIEPAVPPIHIPKSPSSSPLTAKAKDGQSETGSYEDSLPSHDSEDDDAEPDWLPE